MAIQAKTRTTGQQKCIVCKKCNAPHYERQLTCKRCGEYFEHDDSAKSTMAGALMGAVILLVAIVGVLKYMHVI